MINYSEADINREMVYNAYRGISFTPEQRANTIIADYIIEMSNLVNIFAEFVTSENEEAITADLERYRQGYIKKLNAYLSALSRCLSSMITGPANFPVRRNEKANASTDKRRDEFLEYCTKVKKRLYRTYDPKLIAAAPISSDDDQAIEKLQAKINNAEALQTVMKVANIIIRKKATNEQKIAALVTLDGINEQTASKLLEPDYMGKPGFRPYQLQNNNANIQRMKQRIEQLKTERSRAPAEDKIINGVTVSENTDMNRLQLFFDGKPPVEIRQKLKSHGFRWSPRQGAWQRQLNDNARYAANLILEETND